MPRGGSRPGAGRKPDQSPLRLRGPRLTQADKADLEKQRIQRATDGYQALVDKVYGVRSRPNEKEEKQYNTASLLREARQQRWVLPLEYFLAVLNSPDESDDRKFQAALAAAPYCHPKYASINISSDDTDKGTDLDAVLADLAGRLIADRSGQGAGVPQIIDQRPSGQAEVRVAEVLVPPGAETAAEPVDRVVSVRRSRFR